MSSAAVAATRSEPPHGGNCAHQLANYLAHQPHCLVLIRQHQPITLAQHNVGVRPRLLYYGNLKPLIGQGKSRSAQ